MQNTQTAEKNKTYRGKNGNGYQKNSGQSASVEVELFDLNAERAVLGAFMAYPYLIARHEADLAADDFQDELHRQVFARLRVLAQRDLSEIGPELVTSRVSAKAPVMDMSAANYIQRNLRNAYCENPDEIAEVIAELHLWTKRRAAKRISELAARLAPNGGDDVLELIAKEVTRHATRQTSVDFFEPLGPKMVEEIDRALERDATGWQINGVPTGFDEIDEAIGGFEKGNFYVIAAQEKMGKTSCALSMLHHQLSKGFKAGFVSLEMNQAALARRLLTIETAVRLGYRKPGTHLTEHERRAIIEARGRVASWPISASQIFNIKPSTLRLACSNLMASEEFKPDILYIDYLQLIAAENDRLQTRERVEAASGACRALANDLNIPVVALAQLNRKSLERGSAKTFKDFKREAFRPRHGDLKETARIEGDVHALLTLYRPEVFFRELDPSTTGAEASESDNIEYLDMLRPLANMAELGVLLSREGRDRFHIEVKFIGDLMKFVPMTRGPVMSCYDPARDGPISQFGEV